MPLVTRFLRSYGALRLPVLLQPQATVVPCSWPTARRIPYFAARLFGPACFADASVCLHCAWGWVLPAPRLAGSYSWTEAGPPRFLDRPLHSRRSQLPRRVHVALAHFFCERHAMAFQKDQPLGTRNRNNFVAGTPRLIVSRTYASTRSLPAALQDSLPTRLGSVLIGRDSHPLDDKLDFRKNRILLPSRPALPGRNGPVV
jgi:hypothetical protein